MEDMPKRKHPRLKDYNYSQDGYYHITICTYEKIPILSNIIVGRGLAPAEPALTLIGRIVEEQLQALPERYQYVRIDKYIIMPTHLHVVLVLQGDATRDAAGAGRPTAEDAAGASPRPTLTDIICTFKSISTRLSNHLNNTQGRKLWQTSFYDEIIRNDEAYLEIWTYIDENPIKWSEDKYFCKNQDNVK